MFGRKQIAELEAHIVNLQTIAGKTEAQRRMLENQVEYLVSTIHGIDKQIYKISQCTSFEQMRPDIKDLVEGMIMRKHAESDRISEILRPELIKTYNAQKRIE